ncbi:MAG: hypothetical protein LBV17_06165 [Treponema sp.]|jgi:hypothetical protein|nr:hypothetical protein [Treponema sp.]
MKKIIYVFCAACLALGSCSTGEGAAGAAARLFGGSSEALLFLNCRAASEDEVQFEFSRPVKIKSLSFEPNITVVLIEEGSTVKVRLNEVQQPGKEITADILAEDPDRNTINVLIQFRARNNRMPEIVINEICTEYSNSAAGKKEEFIEFKMKSDGNLGAIRMVIMGNTDATKKTVYEFSSAEVKKDEYAILHLRTFDQSNKDEYGDNLDESKGLNASPTARDFWMPGETKLLHKTAAIYVLDQDDRVIDAVMLSENADNWWTKDYFAETAEFLFKQGAWKSADGKICGPKDAVISAGTTNTRTVCRDETVEDSGMAKDWYVTAKSSATPGKLNNPKRLN